LVGISIRKGIALFFATLNQLKFPILTIGSVLGFAYVLNDSGMTISMANLLATTGVLFPFFAPLLGWLGVFITGSDTSSNALFGKLQSTTAASIGVDPVVTVGANVSGGVVGKMISPQSIAVAAGAGGLIGREAELFRFTVKHSFIMLLFMSLIILAQAYLFTWLIPEYTTEALRQSHLSAAGSEGYLYLSALAVILVGIAWIVTAFKSAENVNSKIDSEKIG